MWNRRYLAGRYVVAAMTVAIASGVAGCGVIADKGRIKIAKIRDEYVTRADLERILREMPHDERPRIETRDDLKKVLEGHLDQRIKKELSNSLQARGVIHVPRELAEQRFVEEYPELAMDIPNLEDYGLAGAGKVIEDERQTMIDRIQERMLGEMAVAYRIDEAVKQGALIVTPEELQEEYEPLKDRLHTLETVTFKGVWFDASQLAVASVEAAALRSRLDAGEKLEDIAKEFPPERVMRASVLDDGKYKFESFWRAARGSGPGMIIGPVSVLSPELTVKDATGQVVQRVLPSILLVAEILDSKPSRPLTLEEATPQLETRIRYRKMIESLHREYGVEIYEDKLEDPALLALPEATKTLPGPRKQPI